MKLRILQLTLAFLLFANSCGDEPPTIQARLNIGTSLTGSVPANPLRWQVVTSTIDPTSSTMSTLYGNDVALKYARSHSEQAYPTGSMLALITWQQKQDERWF